MSEINERPSLAVQAYCTQNLYEPSEKYPSARPSDTAFPGHDTFQNGVILNGQPTTFYTAATNEDVDRIKNHDSNMSGFLTDANTVDSCKNADGVLDANLYASKTQTQPWRPSDSPRGTDYTYRGNVAAFDVNWDELNDPLNADLKARLCDEDGNLKCAYGKTEANTHWGEGGGNQYYINRGDFNEGVNCGAFSYNDEKTLKEDDGTLVRKDVSPMEYKAMDAERRDIIDNQLSSVPNQTATSDIEKAHALNTITPEKADQINSAQAAEGNYLCKPDPAYNCSQNKNTAVSGELPAQSTANHSTETPIVAGELPPATQNEHQNDNAISGTTPDQAQGIDLSNTLAERSTEKDLEEDVTMKNSNGFGTNAGIA